MMHSVQNAYNTGRLATVVVHSNYIYFKHSKVTVAFIIYLFYSSNPVVGANP